jgi:tetratricopeptide (TPR) repeat protein
LTKLGVPDGVRSAQGCYELDLPTGARVDVDDAVDLVEAAEAAVRRGDPAGAWRDAAEGFDLATRPFLPGEGGEWVEAKRDELTKLAVRAADALVAAAAARESWSDAVGFAEEAIARAPFRESGYVALVDAHLGAGNRAEALRAYERARSLLAEELGVPPSAPLEEAYRRALSADAPPEVSPARTTASTTTRDRRLLVGRAADLDTLRAALAGAVAGRGRLALVAGEPGVGKTHLAEALAAEAEQQGVLALWGTCWSGEGAPPLWPWTQVLRDATERGRIDDRELLGQLTEGESRTGLLGDMDPSGARFRLFDRADTALRRAAAAGPLLVVVDDLHWADRTSLQLLLFLARSIRSAPLLVLGTYRDTEVAPGEPLAELLDDLSLDAERVALSGLARSDIAELASATVGSAVPAEVEALLGDHTGGNPFFVKELVRLLVAQGRLDSTGTIPAGVREVLDRRVGRLAPRCRDALGVAAVIGRSFDLSLLGSAMGESHDEAADAIDEAVASRIVRETGVGRYTFVHELFRQSVYDGLARAARMRLHHAVGEALEARAAGPGAGFAELAHHFLASAPIGDADRAARYAERAGEQAARVLAFEEAALWYGRALEVLGDPGPNERRAQLLLARGEAEWKSLDSARARTTLAEVAAMARAMDDSETLARAALVIGGGLGGTQPLAEADRELIALLEDALERLDAGDSVLRCRVLARLAAELYLTDDVARRDALSAEAVTMARRLGDDAALATALYARQIAVFGPDGLADREQAADEVLALAAESGDQELAFWGHLFRVWSRTERCLRVDDELAACARIADELGLAAYRAEVAVRRAVVAVVAGRFDEVDRQLAQVDATGAGPASTTLMSLMVLAGWLRGPIADLEPMVLALVEDNADKPLWRAALATLYSELGRLDDAREQLRALRADALPRDGLWLFAMQFIGLACLSVGDDELAASLYPLVLPYAEQAPVGAMGSTMTTIGLLDAARGNADDALAWLDRGRTRNAAHGNVAFALWSRRERAAVLLARDGPGDRDLARTELAELIDELRARGFHGFLVRAERLLADAS